MSVLLRFTAVFALALVSASCRSDQGPRDLLDVTVQLSSDLLLIPESVTVQVVATNRGTNSMQVSAYTCPAVFGVFDSELQRVGPRSPVCLMVGLPPHDLAPGRSFVYEYAWDGSGRTGVLARGTYHIVGEVAGSGGVVVSEAVPIEIK